MPVSSSALPAIPPQPSWRMMRRTRAERRGKPCETFVVRQDGSVRLHRCKICRGFFVAHYSAEFCSDACATVNHQAWVEAHRRPRSPSKAALRRAALAALAAARCQFCGAPFKALRATAHFCSNRCRQKHYRGARKATP
jgi:hypothetical protein